jgi:hypothetical protein
MKRFSSRLTALLALAALSAGSIFAQPATAAPHQITGSVVISQVQVAFIGSAGGGHGRLYFHGQTYPFDVAGLGVGGIGVSRLEARGDVYDLHRLEDFAGLYGQARLGIAVANKGGGYMWLTSAKGVTLRLKAKRRGLMMAAGVDGVAITFPH